jgi:predicted AlkP superfamily phosphohydrolase/phosphomutase
MDKKNRTLLVGLDAACWEYIEPLLTRDRLPTLQRLMHSGTWGTLNSTMPPWTPTAWSSLITGKNPGKHGVFDLLWRRPNGYEFSPTNANRRAGTPFWKRLNEHGLRVGLVNVPFTYPPDSLEGFVVCGFGAPNSVQEIAYPADALSWLREKYPFFEPAVDFEFLRTAPPPDIFSKEVEHQTQQVYIAQELSERYQVDVLVINLMLTDHANHKMPTLEQVQEAYERSDLHLSNLIENFQPDNIMLISDHGSSRLKGDFFLNAWLRDQGYYTQASQTASERSVSLNWILLQWLQYQYGWSGVIEKVTRRFLREILLKLPDPIMDRFWARVGEVIPFAREHVLFKDQPDFPLTKVFPGSTYSGLLFFNILGREPSGIIPIGNRHHLINELSEKLHQIEDPDTKQPLFSNIYSSEDLYNGFLVENAPDLILDSYDKGWNIRTSKHVPQPERIRDKYFLEASHRRDYGWHTREGIFVFSGRSFGTGKTSINSHLMDIPSTLLHLYGIPIPEDYDGRVLVELMNPDFRQQAIHYQPGDKARDASSEISLSTEESEALVEHLRALGYLN